MQLKTEDGTPVDINQVMEKFSAGWGVPTSWYRDRNIFEFEQNNIFSKSWVYLLPAERVANHGDTVTANICETPIFVTRRENGEVEGFLNICRHRGHPVVLEDGNYKRFVCPYHAFVYNEDGSFRSAGKARDVAALRKDELDLIPVAVAILGDAIFVNLDPDAKPMKEAVPEAYSIFNTDRFDSRAGAYHFVQRETYDVAANWKIWYDNHVECYHCEYIHSGTFNTAFHGDPYDVKTEKIGQALTYTFKPRENVPEGQLVAQKYNSIQLFPGFLLIQQTGLQIFAQLIPLGPERTMYHADYFAEVGADEAEVAQWIDIWHQTFLEDKVAVDRQQLGLRTGRVPPNRLVPEAEEQVVQINETILSTYRSLLAPSTH